MAKKVQHCVNHSDVIANDICNRCGKPICYNCMLEAYGLAFCSIRCVLRHMVKKMGKVFFRIIVTILKSVFWPLSWMRKLNRRSWLELIMGIGLIVCFIFVWKLTHDIKYMERGLESKGAIEEPEDSVLVRQPVIFQPSSGGMIYSNSLNISGEADENRIVSLSIDGKLYRVVLPEAGKFIFENVRLHRGQNLLEVRAITEDGDVSSLQSMLITYASPTLTYLSRNFKRGPLDVKDVALTFDAGSVDNAADEILDFLKEKGVKSTFFLTGQFIRNYPETVKRIAAEGHEIGNHTWSHPHLTTYAENRRHYTLPTITPETLREQFSKTALLFNKVTGQQMARLWRAPYGEHNQEILTWAALAGYRHVGWTGSLSLAESMDTLDWVADKNSKVYRSAEEIANKIIAYAKRKKPGANGAIVLMHLGTNRKDDFPHRKLPEIIDALRKEGYEFVKISEMINEGL